eukprot:NODE_7601_length_584_cov_424.964989_g7578_i0.p1 GENE.NODE_7601_length_584_cov_424.964989_g7578_i0~~NODE_7601_length_584_cov_424.964989_g7578_i0.p1  ORF type:complete len:146 (-),score=26.36 NODE_7601_length_584_cov_424.964989_g7578_i0:83-520(-)
MPSDRRACTLKDVDGAKFTAALAAHLKREGKVELPKLPDTVKTAPFKEYSPYDPDWFLTRVAAVARHVYLRPGTGVGDLTKVFGGASRRGVCPSHRARAARGNLRFALQQLEKLDFVEAADNGGRKVSKNGQKQMDLIAGRVLVL